jgi:hypothetical protein
MGSFAKKYEKCNGSKFRGGTCIRVLLISVKTLILIEILRNAVIKNTVMGAHEILAVFAKSSS